MSAIKKPMTDKQKAARMENLKKGREKRMEAMKNKKEQKQDEYDISSDNEQESDSSSDDEGFVISKKKPVSKQKAKPRSRDDVAFPSFTPKEEFDDLKNMVRELALMQKKSNKTMKKQQNNKPVNKLVLLPPAQQTQANSQSYLIRDSIAEQLAKQLFH
jgi:hypothetical protein